MCTMTAKKSTTGLNQLTATEIVRAIYADRATCEDVVSACLEHISEREPEVGAWQYLDAQYAIAQARALDKSGKRGPLIGVPCAIKDVIDTCDMPTEYGSPIYRGHQPKADAACVALTRKACAVVMGKAVTTEFANFHPGKTRNPLDSTRTPGGSSSGSAAAVAAGMVPVAIGTQGTASTIRPASFCGVFGYRPTYGDLRCAGVKEASGSMDTLGLFTRSIEDIAWYRDVLLGVTPEPLPENARIPRIGLCRTHRWLELEPYTQQLIEDAAEKLARADAKIGEVNLPPVFEQVPEAHRWITSFEFARNFTWEIENHWDEISDTLRNGRLKDGLSCSYDRFCRARDLADQCRHQLPSIFGDYDVLLTAPAAGEAPVGLSSTGSAAFCAIWSAMHVPAVTLPVFKGRNGLPVGAQLIGKPSEDRRLFAAARWIYRTLS